MQLKITAEATYVSPFYDILGHHSSEEIVTLFDCLTESHYKSRSNFLFRKETSLMSAKYIMEYLFLEFGVIVCNEGYSIKDMNDTGVQRNILDIRMYGEVHHHLQVLIVQVLRIMCLKKSR